MLKNLFNQQKKSSANDKNSSSDRFNPTDSIDSTEADPTEIVFHYHEETKHHITRFARSLGYMDWANQPDPFRRYQGTTLLQLPFLTSDKTPNYDSLYHQAKPQAELQAKSQAKSQGRIPAQPLNWQTLGQFFELSLALSAWKEFHGTRWALRINPSSGNLHPTEGYLLCAADQIDAAPTELADQAIVCHYAPAIHALEQRARIDLACWQKLMTAFPPGSFLVGLSSIHWREAWKYGERAFRYCQHDIGHALAALRFSAAALGWQLLLLEDLADHEIAQLLGIDRDDDFIDADREHPDLLAVVVPADKRPSSDQISTEPLPRTLPADAIQQFAASEWQGRANALSREQVEWEIIDLVAEAAIKPHTGPHTIESVSIESAAIKPVESALIELVESGNCPHSAAEIIRQRRSAVALDKQTEISEQDFYRMLARTMPSMRAPWDAINWPTSIHLCIFVHRIRELLPGLYILARNPASLPKLQAEMRSDFIKADFLWQKPAACPTELPLYFLHEGNCQSLARQVSCTQDIAGDGVFSLGMVAEFYDSIKHHGSWFYRRLFWETGIIGQVLYLEAEAIGIRATGIGCFFDNPVHEIFGFRDRNYQSLYHFTMGGPVEDSRLSTLPPYGKRL